MEALNIRAGDRVRLSNGDRVTVLGFAPVRVPRHVRHHVWHLRLLGHRVALLVEPDWTFRIRRWLAGFDTVRMVRVSTPEGRVYDDPPPSHLIVPPGLIDAVIDAEPSIAAPAGSAR